MGDKRGQWERIEREETKDGLIGSDGATRLGLGKREGESEKGIEVRDGVGARERV